MVAAIASEEMEDIHVLPGGEDGKYLIATDPLDGSAVTRNDNFLEAHRHVLLGVAGVEPEIGSEVQRAGV